MFYNELSMTITTPTMSYRLSSAAHPPLIRVLHQHEKSGLSQPEWQARELGATAIDRGLPEYVALVGDWVELTSDLQWFQFNLLRASVGAGWTNDELVKAYRWLYDGNTCFTNYNGTGTNKCFITGENMTKGYMRQFPVVTGGNYFEALNIMPEKVYGEWAWK
jgi:hypothetical protein